MRLLFFCVSQNYVSRETVFYGIIESKGGGDYGN